MNGKLYIKKFIRDDGETLSLDAEEIYLSEDNTLLVRSDPATTAVDFTEADGGEMIRQRGAIYHQTVKGLIVPKTSDYWSLCTRLSRFFVFNHTYKIVYVRVNGSMFATNGAWISSGLQIVPVPHENYSYWNIEFAIGDIYWRQYAEDSEGEQTYSNSITLPLITASMGGELWDTAELQSLSGEGRAFQIEGISISATNTDVRLKGDTSQQTYSGAQLLTKNGMATPYTDSDYWSLTAGVSNTDLGDGWGRWVHTGTTTWVNIMPQMSAAISGGTYKTSTVYTILFEWNNVSNFDRVTISQPGNAQDPFDGQESSVAISLAQTSGTSKIALTTKSTLTDSMRALRMFFTKHTTSSDANIDIRVTIVEGDYSSSDLQWQPYVGGSASPNPDYPQDVQVVTGEQKVNIAGKNLLRYTMTFPYTRNGITATLENDNSITLNGTMTTSSFHITIASPLDLSRYSNEPVTVSIRTSGVGSMSNAGVKNGTSTDLIVLSTFSGGTSKSSTGTVNFNQYNNVLFDLWFNATLVGTTFENFNIKPQIESGSVASDYEPYQSQEYTIGLGSIELCKIGDYQDYIYKNGSDWYVHKDIGKMTLNGTGSYSTLDNGTGGIKRFKFTDSTVGNIDANIRSTYCDIYQGVQYSSSKTTPNSIAQWSGQNMFAITTNKTTYSLNDFKADLASNPATAYYALETPTDTKITNASLVAQLNALASARAHSGKTIYSISGTPLPAIFHIEMTQSVGEGEVWDDVGGVWEAGSGGVQTISVDSTQKIYPVWTVTGPCVNPVLQNNTTDTFASFDGTVAAGQTLTVYFEDGIAYLDSAIATRYVSGYVSFLPGENMVGFNSDGGSAETSTISWDNIIN